MARPVMIAVCRRHLSSVTLRICNATHQGQHAASQSCYVPLGRSRYGDTLFTSARVDDVMSSHNAANGSESQTMLMFRGVRQVVA